MGNTASQCQLGLFQFADFAGDVADSKSTSGRVLCIFGSHSFVPDGWSCKKQTAVSHSGTESEVMSLDVGRRLDGFPVFGLWDIVIDVSEGVDMAPLFSVCMYTSILHSAHLSSESHRA